MHLLRSKDCHKSISTLSGQDIINNIAQKMFEKKEGEKNLDSLRIATKTKIKH